MAVFYKIKHILIIRSNNLILQNSHKRNKNTFAKKIVNKKNVIIELFLIELDITQMLTGELKYSVITMLSYHA